MQAISQTQQASVLLQTAEFLINGHGQTTSLPNVPAYQQYNTGAFAHTHSSSASLFNGDDFDGKKSHIISIPATSPDYNNAATLLQEACKKDDAQIIQKVLETCPLATRIVSDGSESGDVAIHIGECSGHGPHVHS